VLNSLRNESVDLKPELLIELDRVLGGSGHDQDLGSDWMRTRRPPISEPQHWPLWPAGSAQPSTH
jgi:hypothetical protein